MVLQATARVKQLRMNTAKPLTNALSIYDEDNVNHKTCHNTRTAKTACRGHARCLSPAVKSVEMTRPPGGTIPPHTRPYYQGVLRLILRSWALKNAVQPVRSPCRRSKRNRQLPTSSCVGKSRAVLYDQRVEQSAWGLSGYGAELKMAHPVHCLLL